MHPNQEQAAPTTIPTPSAEPKKNKWLIPGVVGAVVLIIAIGVGILFWANRTPPIHINGMMTIADTSGSVTPGDGTCRGIGGYTDINSGAQVVISDDTGKTLAITTLGAGSVNIASQTCSFNFSTTVDAGYSYYGVAVSHRGTVKMSKSAVQKAALTIG